MLGQFVTRSIESWFDVRVEKALESGLHLGRSALDSLLTDLTGKAQSMANELSDLKEAGRRSALLRLREQSAVQSAALFSVGGQLLSSASSEISGLLSDLPTQAQLKQARSTQAVTAVEGEDGKLYYFPDDITDKTIEWLHAVRAQDAGHVGQQQHPLGRQGAGQGAGSGEQAAAAGRGKNQGHEGLAQLNSWRSD